MAVTRPNTGRALIVSEVSTTATSTVANGPIEDRYA